MASKPKYSWNEESVLKLITLYRHHEVLWNVKLDQYKNKDARNQAYKMISEEINEPNFGPSDVPIKIKNLGTAYHQEKRKVEDSKKSGSGANDVYKPKVFWFEALDIFMHPVVESRKTHSNLEMLIEKDYESQSNTVSENLTSPESIQLNSSFSSVEHNGTLISAVNNTFQQSSDISQKILSPPPPPPQTFKRSISKKRKNEVSDTTYLDNALKKLDEISERTTQPLEMDEFDAFGKLVSTMLKKLPIHLAFEAQSGIHSLLIKYKLQAVQPSGVFNFSQTPVIYNQETTNDINVEYSSGYNRTLAVPTTSTQISNESNNSSAYSSNDDIFSL